MKREKCPLVFRSGRKMKTKEQLLEQFMAVHGDTYNYSQLEYFGDGTKVKIICSEHGEFWQLPQAHRAGSGCRKCAIESIKPRLTTEKIIERFKEKHGDKFDYSLVEFVHITKKVKIICQIHGEFEQLPSAHQRGQGCAQCMYDDRRHSIGQIIEQFRKVHGDLYDYSLVEYANVDAKVKINCKEHGTFEQTPWDHKAGSGCPKCIGRHKTKDEVITDFINVHGGKYDYSLVDFELITKKVKITCPKHGVFEQEPSKHIAGQGCAKCLGRGLTTEEMLVEFVATHGNKFDYSLVDFVNTNTRVKIICSEHGVFEQLPHLHKSGSGCPACAGVMKLTIEQVIRQFIDVHGEIYDYSLVEYSGAHEKVTIICHEHGEFVQTAHSHKQGSGCMQCAITIEHTRSNYIEVCSRHSGKSHLYLIKCTGNDESFYKVGIAAKGAKARFNTKQKLPYKFEILKEFQGEAGYIWDLEKQMHKLLKKHRYLPELGFNGSTECFSEVPKVVLRLLDEIDSQQIQLIA